jgi:rare lipoprotein A (peptidoglycan hydrolase)
MKVTLIAPVSHDGRQCETGDVIDVSEAAAKKLSKLGFIETKTAAAKAAAGKAKKDQTAKAKNQTAPPSPPMKTRTAKKKGGDAYGDEDAALDADSMTDDELAQELSSFGVGIKSGMTRDQLVALYIKTFAGKE